MFFTVSKAQQTRHPVDRMLNPKNPSNAMYLLTFRTHVSTAVATTYSKKVESDFYDDVAGSKIPRRLWTPDMTAFAGAHAVGAPAAPYVVRLTIIGWIVLALFVVGVGMMTYETFRPAQQTAEQEAMAAAPVEGDLFFGRFENAPEPDSLAASSGIGFGWFTVVAVDGDVYHLARSTDMSSQHQEKERLGSTDFESESTPVKVTELVGNGMTMTALDDSVTFYITDKG